MVKTIGFCPLNVIIQVMDALAIKRISIRKLLLMVPETVIVLL